MWLVDGNGGADDENEEDEDDYNNSDDDIDCEKPQVEEHHRYFQSNQLHPWIRSPHSSVDLFRS